ncbi:MAG TPA: hypothetical protein VHG28_17630 [Longimicrobiaceae bacterium]|nr:hypothetical protein [Longimicrobiaceae bacterium]
MKRQYTGKESARPRRPGRKSPPPPAIMHGPDETLEGALILDEARSGLGTLLWQSLHDVILWASVPPGERRGLFRPESVRRRLAALVSLKVDPALEVALTSLAALVDDPAAVRPEAVGAVCLQIARWAEGQGMTATALAFAQGAALAAPTDATAGFLAGQLARRTGENARAETWLRRTIVLGRRNGDRLSLFQACLALGEMHAERGDTATAHALYLRALRGSRRSGFRDIKAQALYNLFRLTAATGPIEEADTYARSALHAHGRRHPRIPTVARDVARFWLEQGRFDEALTVLRLLLPYARRPEDRIGVLGAIARAAAAAGNEEVFEETAREEWQLLQRSPQDHLPARGVLDLAYGAAELRRWESAGRAAQLALDTALRCGDGEAAAGAEALLHSVWTQVGGIQWQVQATAS